ncbi:Prickle-like protein 2 [Tyrophagus putrescentiae]|nr:Prickle-like protein 2 [Tyrophagus putrescentiae]
MAQEKEAEEGASSASVRKQQTTTTTSSTSSSSLGGKNKLRVLGRDHLKLSSLRTSITGGRSAGSTEAMAAMAATTCWNSVNRATLVTLTTIAPQSLLKCQLLQPPQPPRSPRFTGHRRMCLSSSSSQLPPPLLFLHSALPWPPRCPNFDWWRRSTTTGGSGWRPGANWRHRQLQHQMPIHDAELLRQPTAESRFIRGKQRRALVRSELFLATTQSTKPVTCHRCKQLISGGACYFIHHTTATAHHFFHIDCFKCEECQEVLVDLKAYLHPTTTPSTATTFDHHHPHPHPHHQQQLVNNNGISNSNNSPGDLLQYSLFCCRHFVEIFKPRCPHCDRLILDEECTEAEGKAWHIGHFCCTECSRSLGGQQYIMASSDVRKMDFHNSNSNNRQQQQLPYCLTCFDILFGELCEECGELIGCEVGAIIHEGRSWHATDACFRCSLCLKTLLGKPFLPAMDGRIYCSLTCSQAMENRDQFLKSMTLSRYEQKVKAQNQVQNNRTVVNGSPNLNQNTNSKQDCPVEDLAAARLKALNLSQLVNYEQFIRQSNQYFTSKYDWSKEQEFASARL